MRTLTMAALLLLLLGVSSGSIIPASEKNDRHSVTAAGWGMPGTLMNLYGISTC